MPATRFPGLTRWFLYLLIASIALGAMLAIYLVLAGNWTWFEVRILLTTGVVAGASLVGMACGAAMSRGERWWLPSIGIGLAVLAAVLLIAGMWLEIDDITYVRSTAAASILAVSTAHGSLLSIARLRASHAWIQLVAYALIFIFAMILTGIIFSETGSDAIVRVLAVVGILDAAFTLLVPVVHFLDRRAAEAVRGEALPVGADDDLAAIDAEIAQLRRRISELEARREARQASHSHHPAQPLP